MNDSKDVIKLQTEQLNIGDIINLVVAANCGAISTFIGTTRDNFEGKKVVKLEYEAYQPMALKELENVCSKIRSQWDVERIAIYHRLGVVSVTEASVVIAISSSHRQESLQATQFAIDMLKSTVPIWKKEIYDNHKSQWKENKECSWSTSRDETLLAYANVVSANDLLLQNNHKIFPSGTNQDENEDRMTEKRESFDVPVNSNLVQIRVSTDELNRRINAFIARKREQNNIVNVQEFCSHRVKVDEDRANSCARVDAILIRRKDSKSHVKVHRVLNPWGPQVADLSTLQKTTRNHSNQSSPATYLPALEERLVTSENHIGVKGPVPKDVYQRLKRIEDRILYLESLSPEYRQFWQGQEDRSFKSSYQPVRKRTFSTAELDTKLQELESKYTKKAN
ncbi:molybdopterin synthase catalytic subunit isoform X1 [Neodiprion fabricii]|uniref:molybdopterin synthase catalytic subunit isoform X1 n=1 Tax=Neodiprion fabricii TaxID=2872261 RepID=UPI001ED901E1|nr:molybdopterin synthase catalytic subunit isoform X1 [Neodiprion fabricii]